MTLARTLAVALTGMDGHLLEVECDISSGLPGLSFNGRAHPSVVESRDRVKAAIANSGGDWPTQRMTVALLPADVPKAGSRFDLAVAIAVLAADEQVPAAAVKDVVWIAELGLDGRLRPVRGVLPTVLAARRRGVRRFVVAAANAAEAALIGDVDVRCAEHLAEVLAWLTGDGPALPAAPPPVVTAAPNLSPPDLVDVAGQPGARRALEIAAAGGHHLFLVGSPGTGKTMLAERLPGLLPPLDPAASLEVTAVHSIAGTLPEQARLIERPPFQAPHHTASVASLVGGGSNLARPGAISLAHHGVLFLDETAEFAPRLLDALRQPLESGDVVLHRGGGAVRYPARFQLVLAANPCACSAAQRVCECPPPVLRRHRQRLSGPLMDRVDLRVQVDRVTHAELFGPDPGREDTATVAARVAVARRRAAERLAGTPWRCNAEVPGSVLCAAPFALPAAAVRPVAQHLETGVLSARGLHRLLRVAWTIADLTDLDRPGAGEVSEALFFRLGQVYSWAA